jgi:hypothetical protein
MAAARTANASMKAANAKAENLKAIGKIRKNGN